MQDLAQFSHALSIASVPFNSIETDVTRQDDISWKMLRLDLIDPFLSGNKAFKLLPSLLAAHQRNKKTLISFGGAHSNHLHALSFAGKRFGLNTVGVVQAYKGQALTPTLLDVIENGMHLIYVDKSEYKQRYDAQYCLSLQQQFPNSILIPEGAADQLGLQGIQLMAEVIQRQLCDEKVDFFCTSAGTGSTALGLLKSRFFTTMKMQVFCALESQYVGQLHGINESIDYDVIDDYCCSGFANVNKKLACFIETFERQQNILLDPVYTAKMAYGINDLLENGFYPKGSHIISLHTGGLQGMRAMRKKITRLTLC